MSTGTKVTDYGNSCPLCLSHLIHIHFRNGHTEIRCKSGCKEADMRVEIDRIIANEIRLANGPKWLLNATVEDNIKGYKSAFGRVPDQFFLDIIQAAILEGKSITQEDRENVLKII